MNSRHPSARTGLHLLIVLAAVAAVAVLAPAAGAAGAYARWSLDSSGGAGRETGTVSFGVLGAPRATFTSSVTGSEAAPELLELTADDVIAATSAWGRVLGASTGRQYLWTKHLANAATLTRTTTYTFATPMLPGAFYVALGDIDYDEVDVTAKDPSGVALTGRQIRGGVTRASFNFTYPAESLGAVVVLRAGGVSLSAPTSPVDDGIAAWLRPSRAVATLTTVSHRADDWPEQSTVRTWMAVMAHAVRGRVTVATQARRGVAGAVVRLRSADGRLLGRTRTAADGSFAFPRVYAADGYRLRVAAPTGYELVGDGLAIVDLADGEAFVHMAVVPGATPSVTG